MFGITSIGSVWSEKLRVTQSRCSQGFWNFEKNKRTTCRSGTCREWNNSLSNLWPVFGKLIAYGFPKLKIIPSKTDDYKLTVVKFSRGTTILLARERAESIKLDVSIPDSTLLINNYFLLPSSEKWRNQSVKLILEVPEGKSIFMTRNLENLIYDKKNIDGSWDFDMLGKKVFMLNGRLTGDLVELTDTIKTTK